MPALLISLFWNYALPWLLDRMVTAGAMEAEKATGIKTVADLVAHVKELKTYQQYPTGRNGQ